MRSPFQFSQICKNCAVIRRDVETEMWWVEAGDREEMEIEERVAGSE
jgi:hypothetical protein